MERVWSLGYIFGNKLHRAVLKRNSAEGRHKGVNDKIMGSEKV